MSAESPNSANGSPARERAAQWLFRLRDPEVSAEEIGEWLEWCEAAPENQHEFARMQAIWQQSNALDPRTHDLRGLVGKSREGLGRRLYSHSGWAAAACIVMAIAGALVWRMGRSPSSEGSAVAYTTTTRVNREIALPDGSGVTLAAGSRIVVDFNAHERRVSLDSGEAYFKVRKAAARPFIVHALDVTMVAVGTAFNVRAEEGIVKMAVTQGTVDAEHRVPASAAPSENVRVTAGHQVTFEAGHLTPMIVALNPARATTWQTGTLEFVREPLASVVAAVNRYSVLPITLQDANVGNYHYTGTVAVDRIEDWLRGLPNVFPVDVQTQPSAIVIAGRRKGTPAS